MKLRNKEAVRTVLFVKNDEAGQNFLRELKAHLNCGWRLTIRGRNENRRQFVDHAKRLYSASLRQSLPPQYASYFAVYFSSPRLADEARNQYGYLEKQIYQLTDAVKLLELELAEKNDRIKFLFETETSTIAKLMEAERASWGRVWRDVKKLIFKR